MASSTDHSTEHPHLGTTSADKLFLAFLVLVVVAVTWLGVVNYKEALKVEAAKSNGEAWVEWLTEAGTTRFEADTKNAACKGGVKPAADAKADTPGTWGACLAHILANTDLKDQVNAFFNKPPHFVAACDPKDRTLMGAILLEDLMPTPPGSATPFVASQLLETDPIDYKMQLRLSVCDKGGYAIKVAEFEF
ncbi:hypothetical protein [Limnohabitans sp.]|uniref:hypothetical protein n=1 Tax=Limnohabitans sp. TaxID=1907725 RepID=UPI00286F852C|nr:hypothetical protein [Limnohabitans sp.]